MLPKHIPYDRRSGNVLDQRGFEVVAGPFHQSAPWWHRHGGVEIVSVHAGTGQLFYDETYLDVGPGDVVMGPADIPHGAAGRFRRTVIHFMLDLLAPSTRHFVQSTLAESNALSVSVGADAVRRLLWATGELRQSTDCNEGHPVTAHLLGVVIADIKAARNRPRQPTVEPVLLAIKEYMRSHLDCAETLEGLADRFGLSRSHVTNLFTEHLGVAPGEYWLRLRLQHACELLRGDASVRDIAFAVGFQSERGLQRAFSRYYGMTPSCYRKNTGSAAY